MSTKAYSTDLRTRIINYIKLGNSQRGASKLFSVSKSAVNRWWKRYETEGCLNAKPKLGSKGKFDQKSLEEYVKEHPDSTLKEIGTVFKVSGVSIWRRLKKLNFNYKKKRSPMWKQTKTSDPLI
jgi:transposase